MSMIGNFMRVSMAQLEAFQENSTLLEEKIFNDEGADDDIMDVDKAWNGIEFLFCDEHIMKKAPDLTMVFGSEQFVDTQQDLGYGPGQYLDKDQVRNVSKQLSAMHEDEIKKAYQPDKMTKAEIYPSIWSSEGDAFEYLWENIEALQDFFEEAANSDQAIIYYVN
jgi:Domain of unknown function (DUF1877)